MEMSITACDPEKERSRKILQPENDLAQDFQNVALARVLFTGSTFFEKISISGHSRRPKLRMRMRKAVADRISNRGSRGAFHEIRNIVHEVRDVIRRLVTYQCMNLRAVKQAIPIERS